MKMKKMKILIGCLLSVSLGICSCGKEVTNAKVGEYKSESGAKVTILEDNKLVISNYDFAEMEANTYEAYAIGEKAEELGRELSEEEKKEICDEIDLTEQFIDQECTYTTQQEDGIVGLYIPVNGTEIYMYLQYYPADDTLIMNDILFQYE